MEKAQSLFAGAVVFGVAVGALALPAMALCPSPLPAGSNACETGTIKYVASNAEGYKVKIQETGHFYAVQYGVVGSEVEAFGLIAGLADGTSRSVLTSAQQTSLGNNQYLEITVVRNADQ